jgi:uncharacterized membrane-anchored protein
MKIAALVVLSLLQLTVAGWSIVRYESVLSSGTSYRIRAAPIDPADAFRGRYVAVRPAILIPNPIAPGTEEVLKRVQTGETGYAVLTTRADGFAQIARVVTEPPDQGDYLKISHVWQPWVQGDPGARGSFVGYNVSFPFDRYYMNESQAPAAEQRFADAVRRNAESTAWLVVRVKKGAGVIEGLFIDGVRIEDRR